MQKKIGHMLKWAFIKNPQFLPNLYETWSKYWPHQMIILTKFHNDWAKIGDFLLKAHFSMCPIFFASDFITIQFLFFYLAYNKRSNFGFPPEMSYQIGIFLFYTALSTELQIHDKLDRILSYCTTLLSAHSVFWSA